MHLFYGMHSCVKAALVTLLFGLFPLLTSAQYDANSMCTEAAQGLLPEDAQTYIQNCLSDYRANMGEQDSALTEDLMVDGEDGSESRLVYEELDDEQVDSAVDDTFDGTESRGEMSSEVTE